jgi:putative protein-disulfide isomerase
MARLFYFHDPLCGWCYAAAPLVDAAARVPGLGIEMLAGGLWPEPFSPPRELRERIRGWDARVGEMTGQPFGEAYLNGWLNDETTMLHSEPPIAAWLAVRHADASLSLSMLNAIQRGHYVRGLRVVEPDVLAMLATELGVDASRYRDALAAIDAPGHIATTRVQMSRFGIGGFPAALLESAGRLAPLRVQSYLGDPDGFAAALSGAVHVA